MKFIELTNRFGEAVTVNITQIQHFYETAEGGTMLVLLGDNLFIKETYEQVKKALGV